MVRRPDTVGSVTQAMAGSADVSGDEGDRPVGSDVVATTHPAGSVSEDPSGGGSTTSGRPGLHGSSAVGIPAGSVVGRQRELRLVTAALAAGRDLLLEGPPGTSKTTLLRMITASFGVPLVFVEGNADLTTARLVGHHDPAEALQRGFSADTFIEGPLVRAMRSGGFLYIEEVNRAPEDTLNALLTAIAERSLTIPRMGVVVAAAGFRLVASMNPFDNIGTSRISSSVYDRLCRVSISYQSAVDETEIVRLRTSADETVIDDSVALARLTRRHPLVRQGSSVRGAIDMALIAEQLIAIDRPADDQAYATTMRDAMHVALSGRIRLDEAAGVTPESVLDELWEQRYLLGKRRAEPG
jgi:MoxR-like ATPase